MRGVLSAICVFEAIILGLAIPATLVVTDLPPTAVGVVGGALAVVSLINAGLVRRTVGVWIGSALQLVLIGTGFVVQVMFVLGLVFAGLWIWALFAERRLERLKLRQAEQATGPNGNETDPETHNSHAADSTG